MIDLVEADKNGIKVVNFKEFHFRDFYRQIEINYYKADDGLTYAISATKGVRFCLANKNVDKLEDAVHKAIDFLYDYKESTADEAKGDNNK